MSPGDTQTSVPECPHPYRGTLAGTPKQGHPKTPLSGTLTGTLDFLKLLLLERLTLALAAPTPARVIGRQNISNRRVAGAHERALGMTR